MGVRGFGHLYKPTYRDKRTGEVREAAFWWLKWGHEGRTFRESTKTTDRQAAETFRKRKFAEIWGGRAPWEPQTEQTLEGLLRRAIEKARIKGRRVDAMELAASRLLGQPTKLREGLKVTAKLKRERARIEAVKLAHPATPANRVNEATFEKYAAARIAQGYSPATVNRDASFLRRAFNVAWRTKDEYGNPLVRRVPVFEMLEEADPRAGFFTEAEFQSIRGRLRWCLPQLVDFYRVTGWRMSEVLKITWDRVDTVEGAIRLDPKDTKAKKWRDAWPYHVHPVLREVVELQQRRKREVELEHRTIVSHLFFWEDGRPIRDWRGDWTRARKDAGLPNKLVHDFRRTAARDAIKATGDRKLARRLIGAKTDSIFDRYNVVSEDDVEDAARKLAAYQADRGAVEQIVLPFGKKASGG